MHKRSGAMWVIAASGLCAGLVWASQGLADLVRRPSIPRASVTAGAEPDARLRAGAMFSANPSSRVRVAPPTMPALSLEQPSYSMAAPELLLDPAAARAHSVAVGDVSGDGRDDLVFLSLRSAGNPMEGRVEVYVAYQRSDGRLDAAVKIAESNGIFAYQVLVADLDRDGAGDDIVTTTADGVLVLRSNADGTFTSSTAVTGDPMDLTATDVDRDGHLDVLADSSDMSATVVAASAAYRHCRCPRPRFARRAT